MMEPRATVANALDEALRRELGALVAGAVRFDVPLAPHTSWKVGGPADAWVEPASASEVGRVLAWCAARGVPVWVLGKGSNVLVADAGVRGVVLSLERGLAGIAIEPAPDDPARAEAVCGGGASLVALVRRTVDAGWAGVEGLAGIPGTVGGAVRMNAGTHLAEVRDALHWAEVVGETGACERRPLEALGLRYRGSALGPREVVVRAAFTLRRGDAAALRASVRALRLRRRRTQPLAWPSGGSTFRNPPGLKAWQLLDEAGLRGHRVGGAAFSEQHPNFIVNLGGATAADIAALIRLGRERVRARRGVELVPEVQAVGAWEQAPW